MCEEDLLCFSARSQKFGGHSAQAVTQAVKQMKKSVTDLIVRCTHEEEGLVMMT